MPNFAKAKTFRNVWQIVAATKSDEQIWRHMSDKYFA
jgi:hypothetical protein